MSTIRPCKFVLKTGETIEIRSGKPNDAQRLIEITSAVLLEGEFLIAEPDEFQVTVSNEKEWIASHMEDDGKLLLVAETDAKIVGMIDFHNGIRRRMKHRGVFGIIVADSWRNRGIGRLLILTLLQWAENHAFIEKVCLSVLSNNTQAVALYEKLGFVQEGRRKREYKIEPGRYADDILMAIFTPKDPGEINDKEGFTTPGTG